MAQRGTSGAKVLSLRTSDVSERRSLFPRPHLVARPPCSARPRPFQRTHPPHPASISHSGSSQLTTHLGPERASLTAGHTRLRGVPAHPPSSHPTRQVRLRPGPGSAPRSRPSTLCRPPPSPLSSGQSDVQRSRLLSHESELDYHVEPKLWDQSLRCFVTKSQNGCFNSAPGIVCLDLLKVSISRAFMRGIGRSRYEFSVTCIRTMGGRLPIVARSHLSDLQSGALGITETPASKWRHVPHSLIVGSGCASSIWSGWVCGLDGWP